MFKKLSKYFSLILVLGLVLVFPGICLASPLTLYSPASGEGDVPVDGYFQWQNVGAVKYVLDIDQFTQSEDNIPLSVCSGGTCSFAFLDLTVGNINYLSSYTWRVIAYNALGTPIDSSAEYTFSTEQMPARNGDNGGNRGPFNLANPLDADTLQEALNSFLNFLFFLAIALAPILIVYAAFLILTSGGDAAKINRGKQIILWTLIAVALVLFAKGFPALIKGAFGG